MRSVRVWVPIPGQSPIRIEVHEHGWDVVGQDALPNRPLEVVLSSKLRDKHKRCRLTSPGKFDHRHECLMRYANAPFDGRVAAVGHQQPSKRHQPRLVLRSVPDEPRPEMRAILIEVPAEQLAHAAENSRLTGRACSAAPVSMRQTAFPIFG